MVKTIEDLKKERDNLLRKKSRTARWSAAKKSLEKLGSAKRLEEKKLKAEIRALKNPGSAEARKKLRSAGSKFGAFVKRRAAIVSENLNELSSENPSPRSRPRKKTKRSRKR